MGCFYRFFLTILLFAAIGLTSPPSRAKNIGADPPVRCGGCVVCKCPPCSQATRTRPLSNCSSSQTCISGTCFSFTEGTDPETYPVVSVRSSTGAMLDLSLTYDSYNADTSRARFNTVLGIGWTHSYNHFLFS